GSGLNVGGVHLGETQPRETMSMPVLLKALEIQTYGALPWKMPMPPRSCCLPLPCGSQLKPRRGSQITDWLGTVEVDRPRPVCTAGLKWGLVLKCGLSPRSPRLRVSVLVTCH